MESDFVQEWVEEVDAMSDEITIMNLQQLVDEYVREREWNRYHKPKDVAMSISIEASELLELFQWRPDSQQAHDLDGKLVARIGEELADIVIYCVCMSNALNINLSIALKDKIEKNRRKYPVAKVRNTEKWDEVRSVIEDPSEDKGDG